MNDFYDKIIKKGVELGCKIYPDRTNELTCICFEFENSELIEGFIDFVQEVPRNFVVFQRTENLVVEIVGKKFRE
jgi:hypothetical protein